MIFPLFHYPNAAGTWVDEGEELPSKAFERNLTTSLEIMNATQSFQCFFH
ncbi:MAG: hypothetical protein R2772_09100 [Chitinophagales bacterium]